MTTNELEKSPEYWMTGVQGDVFNMVEGYEMAEIENLGISKKEIRKILSDNYNPKLLELITLACNLGYIPEIKFIKKRNVL